MTEFIPPGSRFLALPSPFPMKRGGQLRDARVAYETWGTLAADRSNALLIVTGLSPDAHAAAHADDPSPGWWEAMLGAGKPIDTQRWFVICVNSLGSCKGSTGPASPHPDDAQPYRRSRPLAGDRGAAREQGHGSRPLALLRRRPCAHAVELSRRHAGVRH
jgi:homoserine O-acetyltransferase